MKTEQALQKYQAAEFDYGVLDCCLFVANVIRDLTGKDYAAPWRGRYSSEFGALRMVAEHRDLAGIACKAFGEIRPAGDARNGDPVLIKPPFCEHDSIGAALGVCHNKKVVYLTEKGLAEMPLIFARGCWHV